MPSFNGLAFLICLLILTLCIAGSASASQTVSLPNGNYLVVNTSYTGPGNVANVGSVALYNGSTNALISTLTGSTAGDQIGSGGVTALNTGYYLVISPHWSNGTAANAGAITFLDPTKGFNGPVSAANSLVGSSANDQIGAGTMMPVSGFPSGYLLLSPHWSNGAATNAGAITPYNLTSASPPVGPVASTNSLVGSSTNDQIGTGTFTLLPSYSSGYLIRTPNWSNGAGAITVFNVLNPTLGPITSANSLVGSTANDQIGSGGIMSLPTYGDGYLIRSPNWSNGTSASAGAITVFNADNPLVGAITATNSLVGSSTNDQIGSGGITSIPTQGSGYLIQSPHWTNGSAANAGAITHLDVGTPTVGPITAANSLVGSSPNDQIGSAGIMGLASQPSGYLIRSPNWTNGTTTSAGAITHYDASTPLVGPITATNSLVGSTTNDQIGGTNSTFMSLASQGTGYLIRSPNWSNGAGAITHYDASNPLVGPISASNSLVGSSAGDQIGSGAIMSLLTQGTGYLVLSPKWSSGTSSNAGAITYYDVSNPLTGQVSAANSLIGSSTGDQIGSGGVSFIYSVGYYLALSPNWSNGPATQAGALTYFSFNPPTAGPISMTNSLVGSHPGDHIGSGGYSQITNGYLLLSPNWCYGAGATTVLPTSPLVGVVSAANSMVGATSAAPNLVVQQPASTAITNGSTQNFGSVNVGSSNVLTFTVSNTGTNDLLLGGAPIVQVSGNASNSFSVTAQPSNSLVVAGASTTFTVQFFPTSGGTLNATLALANNDPLRNPFTIQLTGSATVPIGQWRTTYFGSANNSGPGTDLSTPANDGIPNIMKYALGLNPTQNCSGQLPVATVTGGNLVISFTQPAGVTGITYGAQSSATLSGSDWQSVPDTGVVPMHVFAIPMGTNTQQFMRLQFSSP